MKTIKIEQIEAHGVIDLVGFTEDHVSFLHLSEEEFTNAKKIGTKTQIEEMTKEYYDHLKSIEKKKQRIIEFIKKISNRNGKNCTR